MKKYLSFLLSLILIILLANPTALANEEEKIVQIPCQYIVGNTVAETTIQGVIAGDGNLYVAPEEVEKVTGHYFSPEENVFVSRNAYSGYPTLYRLDVDAGCLYDHDSPFYPNQTWNIPLRTSSDGSISLSLSHILTAMNAEMLIEPSGEIPLSIYRPFTIFDAKYMLLNDNYFFTWTEVDETATQQDIALLHNLSSIISLIMDYNSHFVSDIAFAWWSEDVLNANEHQYLDALVEIMTCFSQIDPNITDSLDYQTLTLQGEVFGLTHDMMKLLGIDDDALKLLGFSSNFTGIGTGIIEQVSQYQIYQQISESQKDLLESTFLSDRENSVFQDEKLKIIKNAAQHLQTLLDDSTLGTATAVYDGIVEIGSDVVQGMSPLGLMDVASFIMSILPGTSQALDLNETITRATCCSMLQSFAQEEYARINDEIRENGLSEDLLRENKETLLFALQSSYAIRNLLIQNNVFSSDVTQQLKQNNSDTLEFILFLQSCSTKVVTENKYDWNEYAEKSQNTVEEGSSGSSIDPGAYEKYLSAVTKTTASGSWSEQLSLEAEMSISAEGESANIQVSLHSDSTVSNYKKDDLSQVEISSISDMQIMGQNFVWTTEYRDGVAHIQYTEPSRSQQSMEIPPDLFNFDSISRESIMNQEILGKQIRFTVSGQEFTGTGFSTGQISGMNNLEYEDVDVIVTLHDSGSVDQIIMEFGASMEYMGYDATATYQIRYSFSSPITETAGPFDYDTATQIILDYYNQLHTDDGNYIIVDEETLEYDDRYVVTIRYQMSDKEVEERLSKGLHVEPNTLTSMITIEKETGRIYGDSIYGESIVIR